MLRQTIIRTLILLACCANLSPAAAQDPDTTRIDATITDSIALAPLKYLASDKLKGRHIASPTIDTAAGYIVSQFRNAGAIPVPGATGYFQPFKKTISRHDFRRVGQGLKYNLPNNDPEAEYSLKNIVAYIPGTDPALKGQYIMLSSHYDHIGIADEPVEVEGKPDSIYNGARDNATGTAAVIAAALYFGKYPPRRSVLLICFTAEEEGEFGSQYYAEYPMIPLRKTVYDLNCDNAAYDTTGAICLFGLGRTSADPLIKKACRKYDLGVLPEPHGLGLFERSDNYSLAKNGVPAPCFSLGMARWDGEIEYTYHQCADNFENLDLTYITKFIRSYILAAQYIANDPAQPTWIYNDEYQHAWRRLYTSALHASDTPHHAHLPSLSHP